MHTSDVDGIVAFLDRGLRTITSDRRRARPLIARQRQSSSLAVSSAGHAPAARPACQRTRSATERRSIIMAFPFVIVLSLVAWRAFVRVDIHFIVIQAVGGDTIERSDRQLAEGSRSIEISAAMIIACHGGRPGAVIDRRLRIGTDGPGAEGTGPGGEDAPMGAVARGLGFDTLLHPVHQVAEHLCLPVGRNRQSRAGADVAAAVTDAGCVVVPVPG